MELQHWLPTLITAAIGAAVVVVTRLVPPLLRRWGRTAVADDLRRLRAPILALAVSMPGLVAARKLEHAGGLAASALPAMAAVVWLLLRLLWVGEQVLFRRLEIDQPDNLLARSRRTRLQLLRRIFDVFAIATVTLAYLLTFTPLAEYGPTIVAYAGIIGVILGFALRTPIENLAAGMMVAFSEPVRMDDVVVVDGFWGRIESIGLVNVVVRIWDDRRLVLPTSRFVNEPFENWTKSSSELLGTATLWLDYTADIDELRAELDRVVTRSSLWDGRMATVQVVELGTHAMQVRVLVSARTGGELWDLRCEVREALLPYVADPDRVPLLRTGGSSDRPRELAHA